MGIFLTQFSFINKNLSILKLNFRNTTGFDQLTFSIADEHLEHLIAVIS
jgi:hypothetical protein